MHCGNFANDGGNDFLKSQTSPTTRLDEIGFLIQNFRNRLLRLQIYGGTKYVHRSNVHKTSYLHDNEIFRDCDNLESVPSILRSYFHTSTRVGHISCSLVLILETIFEGIVA